MFTPTIRKACPQDRQALLFMQALSFQVLGHPAYTATELESFLRHVGTMDGYLIDDGTYYVAEIAGEIVGCGGWTARAPGYARHRAASDDADARSVARIRSVFVHPLYAGQGIGRTVMKHAEDAAQAAGQTKVALTATLMGVWFYRQLGYAAGEAVALRMPDGVVFRALAMSKDLAMERRAA